LLHLLFAFIESNEADTFLDKLLDALKAEMISETRPYIEWLIIRSIIRFPELAKQLITALSIMDSKAHFTSSLLCVSLHVGRYLSDDDQLLWFDELLSATLPWLTSNHFTIRNMAQYTVYKAWKFLDHRHVRLVEKYSFITATIDFINSNPECKKNRKKCDSYYLFNGFDPANDMNIEFLFRGLPTILELPYEEKISCIAFVKLNTNFCLIPTGYEERRYIQSVVSHSTYVSRNLGRCTQVQRSK
jgi:hypothetical protein